MTMPSTNDWTINSLKTYMDQRFTDSDKAVLAALVAQKETAAQLATSTDKRFDQVIDKIDILQTTMNQTTGGRTNSDKVWSLGLPALLSAAGIITMILVVHP